MIDAKMEQTVNNEKVMRDIFVKMEKTVNNEKVMEDIFVKNENEESAEVTDNYVVCDACHLSFSLI